MPVACARQGRSPTFPLAPSASRSRLKLCRGTDAFRGNGTQAEWTKRQAFGHCFFPADDPSGRLRKQRGGVGALFPLRALFHDLDTLRSAGPSPYCPSRTGR
jgi:hypothetical protein